MRLLFVADLHYTLKQFDWVLAEAPKFDGDLLEAMRIEVGLPGEKNQ